MNTSDVTMVGLGRMGATVAEGLLAGGVPMTVWNRTADKMVSFVERGALGAADMATAVAASPVLILCIDDYSATRVLLDNESVRPVLAERIVVQLSTGTPREAEEAESWCREQGAAYLDGAILGGPDTLGGPQGKIIYSGSPEVYERAQSVLQFTCHNVRHVGERIGAAAVLDMAWLCRHYGMFAGVSHGALLCENEGVDLDHYAAVIPETEYAHGFVNVMAKGDFQDTGATLRTWAAALEVIRRHSEERGIHPETPRFFYRPFEQALSDGLGEEDVAALVKTLRASVSPD